MMRTDAANGSTLAADSLSFSYRHSTAVLQGVSAQIEPGSFLAILGMNGSGKSTLLSCLDGLLSPQRGVVTLDGRELEQVGRNERAQGIAYVTQHSHANRVTVYDALLLGRKPYIRTAPGPQDYQAVDDVIVRLNLEPFALRFVDELSGGEYQKMIIARAFVQQADVLLLDEPTNNLDMANQAEVLQMVRDEVDSRNLAAVAVMHDINLALRYCDRFLLMKEGKVVVCGGPEVITPAIIKEVYGIDADIITHAGRSVVIPGVSPCSQQ